MKNLNLHRLLIVILVMILSGFSAAFADSAEKEDNKDQDKPSEFNVNDLNIDNIICQKADPNQVFVIIDHYDHIISQGNCSDVMVKFFLTISDPLIKVDNISYYRLEYENPEIMKQRLSLKEEYPEDLSL